MRDGAAPDRGDIAVVGVACRFPGAPDLPTFWHNLVEGVESITFFSDDELRLAGIDPILLGDPNYVKAASLLEDCDAFDAEFFGYSPREARLLDPQHRLFLEVAWHAFEAAGYDPSGAKGIVGVYAGAGGLVSSQIVACDIPDLRGQTGDLGHIANDRDFLCPRTSFKLNLTGPSINVQTACSTSLVAVHLGCQALRDGEIDMALAGASVVRVPQITGYMAEPGGIYSPDGHCRAFDERGGGTLFGSGVAAVVLKPLGAARRDGDRIYAVIKGSAVTNDGAMKINFTATAAESQSRASVEAMAMAGVEPESIGYVECHGTATAIGDPVEIQALTRAFRLGTKRTGFCPVGSVKSNFGHLEQCAGIAGLIKTILILQHGLIPPSLHFETPNKRIPFDKSPFFVNAGVLEFDRGSTPRRAAVNSLGMGGTNAFMVLEEAPEPAEVSRSGRTVSMLNLSAKSEESLTNLVRSHKEALSGADDDDLRDICFTANSGRHHFPLRFSAVGSDKQEMLDGLNAYPGGNRAGKGRNDNGQGRKVVFLYSGQGSQYGGMGAELYRTEPRFKARLDACFDLFADAGVPVADAMFDEDAADLNETLYAQCALFSLQVALTDLWSAWGIRPDVVIGHSIGEFAGAVASGVLSLEAAAGLVAKRAQLMQSLPKVGTMVSIAGTAEAVRAVWPDRCDDMAIAALNGPRSTVVSGKKKPVSQLVRRLRRLDIAATELNVSHAFHSPLMDPMLAPFESAAADIEARVSSSTWISTVTGTELAEAPTGKYWAEQLRNTVCFKDAVEATAEGAATYVEIGPGTTLIRLAQQCLSHADGDDRPRTWAYCLSRDESDWRAMTEALRRLYAAGHDVDWTAFESGAGRRVDVPHYPFERKRWHLERRTGKAGDVAPTPLVRTGVDNPFLGSPIGLSGRRFEAIIGLDRLPYLADHRVFGTAILPTTAALEAVIAAAATYLGFTRPVIGDFLYQKALCLTSQDPVWCQTVFEQKGDHVMFRIESTGMDVGDDWQLHITGTVREDSERGLPPSFSARTATSEWAEVPREAYYRYLAARGLSYGPNFQGVSRLWRSDDNAFAKVLLPVNDRATKAHLIHPALLDACLHIYPALARKYADFRDEEPAEAAAYVPISLDAFQIYRSDVSSAWVHATALSRDGDDEARIVLDVDVYGEDGAPVARFAGLTIQETTAELMLPERSAVRAPVLYQLEWEETAAPEAVVERPNDWFVFSDTDGIADGLAERLEADGCKCAMAVPESDRSTADERAFCLDPTDVSDFEDMLARGPADSVGIVYLWPLRVAAAADARSDSLDGINALVCGGCLSLVKSIETMRRKNGFSARLWLVTRGAHGGDGVNSDSGLLQSPVWGLGRTLALEYPDVWGGLIDLPPDVGDAAVDTLWQEIMARDSEDQVKWNGGRRLVPRISRSTTAPVSDSLRLAEDGTYWIVGAFGDVGMATAAALVGAGAKHLVLTGRGAPGEAAAAAIADLRQSAEVVTMSSDVTKRADVMAVLDHIRRHLPCLKGVVHAAAVFEDAVLSNTTWEQFQRVADPKVQGAWVLHQCLQETDLDFFVLYSSVLSLWGAVGQASYTAANSFLDALAHVRRSAGLPATVVNWGPWATAASKDRWGNTGELVWSRRGTRPCSPDAYLSVLRKCLNRGPEQLIAVDTDWMTFSKQFETIPPLYRNLVASIPRSSSRDGLEDKPGSIGDEVRRIVSDVLGLKGTVDASRPLTELGLDSLLAVNLVNRLRQGLGCTVAAGTLLKGVSTSQLIADLFPDSAETDPPAASSGEPVHYTKDRPWLIFPKPNPAAVARLICFPFAGGGAATFRPWAERLHDSIELMAVEPPGRQTRLDETPIRDLNIFLDQLLPELVPLLDRPFAVYGHCLGALTAFEAARRLIGDHGLDPAHIFVSGARPPDQIHMQQEFETVMLENLLKLPNFNVFDPIHEQPDDVFAAAILGFNIPATAEMLADPELRRLILPVIRAEFEMSSRYRYTPEVPWDVPITCVNGRADVYATKENAQSWSRFTRQRFQLFELESEHFLIVDETQFLIDVINRELVTAAPGELEGRSASCLVR